MTHETKLLPCPFCKGEAEVFNRRNGSNLLCQNDVDWWISCEDCGCQTCMHESRDIAFETWNTRHTQDELKRKADMADELIRVRDVLVSAMKSDCGRHLHQYGVENETLEVALAQAEQIAKGE